MGGMGREKRKEKDRKHGRGKFNEKSLFHIVFPPLKWCGKPAFDEQGEQYPITYIYITYTSLLPETIFFGIVYELKQSFFRNRRQESEKNILRRGSPR